MAERAIDWLEIINQGATDKEIRDYFMENIASTGGCRSIIRHWKRFMEWNNDEFLKFILEGLDRIERDKPLKNEDGSLTGLGKRRMLWMSAKENPERLREDLEIMKKINLSDSAAAMARQFLPERARLEADFYMVLFGGSSAYSVGDENGFDMLQMPRHPDSTLDIDEALRTFAHELHHTGYAYCNKSKGGKETQLLGILAAEGMPTFFIDGLPQKAEKYTANLDKVQQDIAREWHEHQAHLSELYVQAEEDIGRNLNNEMNHEEIFKKWMHGLKGPAYVLGADMFSVIDRYLGVDSAKIVADDFRQFLVIYNKAAQIGNKSGGDHFVFDKALAERLAEF